MTTDEYLRQAFVSVEVNADFSEAVVILRDGSKLCFVHRVGERRIEAIRANESPEASLAAEVLAQIARFRLNAKHLDVQFTDGSRWEALFR
jgi:hypothetical protein